MVHKGFAIDEECERNNVTCLYKPPIFYKYKVQFEPAEVENCRTIACARVHVEQTIQRIRLFKIFNDKLDWCFLDYIDEMLIVVCSLVNLLPSILAEDRYRVQ